MRIFNLVNDFAGIVLIDAECQEFGVIEKRIAFSEKFGDDAARREDVHRRLQRVVFPAFTAA